MTSFLLACLSASSISSSAFSLARASARSSLSLYFSASYWILLSSRSATLCWMISKFLSRFKTNFYLSASASAATSLAHCYLSISCSLNFFSLIISASLYLFSFYQVRILTVSWIFFFFSAASVFSLCTFLSWSNIHSFAYTYSSTIYYSSLAFLSISCFSLSMLQPAIIKLVSSFLRSSVSILNFLSRAYCTCYCLSSSL